MKFLVTAGPTREFLDPVRFLSNRSTGKMGYAVACAARDRGHEVRVISGPVSVPDPVGLQVTPVVSADDMLHAVQTELAWCDALVMAAAVADWRPATRHAAKLKKSDMRPTLPLERTPDILASIRDRMGNRTVVGFAAETGSVTAEAGRKLREKGLSAIVANDVSDPEAGFAVDTNRVTVLTRDGAEESWPLLEKAEVGRKIVELVERLSCRAT